MSNLTRRLLEQLRGKAGQIDEGQLRAIAGRVKEKDLTDETELRQLIRTLAAMTGAQVSTEKEDRLVQLVRDGHKQPNAIQALIRHLSS